MSAVNVELRAKRAALFTIGVMVVTAIVAFFMVGARNNELRVFVVDLKRANVPHPTPGPSDPSADPPVAFGVVRFNELQELVDWEIQDSFRDAYPGRVADMRFHGPLIANETVAPVVFAMGTQTNPSDSRIFSGSNVAGFELINSILGNSTVYYVALYVTSAGGSSHVEVARSRLMKSKKK